jgi:hypothetical protein
MQMENQLRTEIEFWHDVIESQGENTEEHVMARMFMAKSLAESKLALLMREGATQIN